MDSDVGGVIVDAHFVHRELCKFLEGKANHFRSLIQIMTPKDFAISL